MLEPGDGVARHERVQRPHRGHDLGSHPRGLDRQVRVDGLVRRKTSGDRDPAESRRGRHGGAGDVRREPREPAAAGLCVHPPGAEPGQDQQRDHDGEACGTRLAPRGAGPPGLGRERVVDRAQHEEVRRRRRHHQQHARGAPATSGGRDGTSGGSSSGRGRDDRQEGRGSREERRTPRAGHRGRGDCGQDAESERGHRSRAPAGRLRGGRTAHPLHGTAGAEEQAGLPEAVADEVDEDGGGKPDPDGDREVSHLCRGRGGESALHVGTHPLLGGGEQDGDDTEQQRDAARGGGGRDERPQQQREQAGAVDEAGVQQGADRRRRLGDLRQPAVRRDQRAADDARGDDEQRGQRQERSVRRRHRRTEAVDVPHPDPEAGHQDGGGERGVADEQAPAHEPAGRTGAVGSGVRDERGHREAGRRPAEQKQRQARGRHREGEAAHHRRLEQGEPREAVLTCEVAGGVHGHDRTEPGDECEQDRGNDVEPEPDGEHRGPDLGGGDGQRRAHAGEHQDEQDEGAEGGQGETGSGSAHRGHAKKITRSLVRMSSRAGSGHPGAGRP